MSRFRTIALIAALAGGLTMTQPRPAEAGSAGKIIAGIAIGAVATALLSHHHHRAYARPSAYYHHPRHTARRSYHHHAHHRRCAFGWCGHHRHHW